MVYDPIYGCVRGRNRLPMKPISEEMKKEILELLTQKLQDITVKRGLLRFMIGLQRSGKSVWATKWMRDNARIDDSGIVYPRAVVCADNIRLAVCGKRYNRRIEPTTFMIKGYMIESLLSRGHDVLVDGTHTTRTSIERIFEIDIDAQWTLINTPVEVCKQRAVETGQPDLVPVLDRTNRQLQALLAKGIPQVCEEIRQGVRERWPTHHENS